MKLGILLLLFFQFYVFQAPQAQAVEYAIFRGSHRGSARTIAMGGAFAGVSDDADAIWSVPAMLLLKSEGVDLILTQSQSLGVDYSIEPNRPSVGLRQEYQLINGTVNSSKHLFGLGVGTPYKEGNSSGSIQSPRLELKERRLVYGYGYDHFAFSATYRDASLEQEIIFQRSDIPTLNQFETEASRQSGYGFSMAYGLKNEFFSGLSYESETRFKSTRSQPSWGVLQNQQRGFLGARVPEKWRLGTAYNLKKFNVLMAAELEYVPNLQDMTSFIEALPQTKINRLTNRGDIMIPHLGVEWFMIERPYFRTKLRGGFYYEPPVFMQTGERYHRTIGFQTKAWIFSFSFAYDVATDFSHFSTSIGISLSDYI